jgi:cell division FtsZ-interacting protein ZapD
MRTIEHVDTGKQLSRSRETLELLVPYARRLGRPVVADELQELARHRIEVLAGEGGGGISATLCALQLASLMLPAAARVRYLEEWAVTLEPLLTHRVVSSPLVRASLSTSSSEVTTRSAPAAASRSASSAREMPIAAMPPAFAAWTPEDASSITIA